MLTDRARKQILDALLRVIQHISSQEYQKRVWIEGKGPECDSFDDTCNYFFDEADGILKNFQSFGLSKDQASILKIFRDEFELFSDDNNWPPLFIDTPEWDQITKRAKEVLEVFEYKK